MSATKEYYLRLQEQEYEELGSDEKVYLNHLGLQVKQLATDKDLEDENYNKIRKIRIDAWNNEQKYLFKKRNK